jgi:lipopolysaccharide export system protein LptA
MLLAMLATAQISSAAPAKAAPITIEADQLELDQKKGISHYRGNVVLQRGGLQIKAANITLHTRENKLHRAIAEGSPVHLTQGATADAGPMRAEAAHMEYLPQSEVIKLRGKAHLWRDGNEFSGEQIRYDLKRQLVKASGDKQGDGRVRVLLQPESEEPKAEEKP